MKLISMTDFVLDIQNWINDKNKQDDSLFANRCVKYAHFLQRPLKLEMFVPCDNEGNILKEPKKDNFLTQSGLYQTDYHTESLKQYEQAKQKVLFENIKHLSYNPVDKSNQLYDYKNNHLFFIEENETIEYLVEYNLQLTTNAIKQFM